MFKELVKLGTSLGLGILASLYYGWVLMTIWGWYFVAGAGLSVMPYIFWVGVFLLWGQLNITTLPKPKVEQDSNENNWLEQMLWVFLRVFFSLVGLGFAWVVFLILL